jgi:uncharacterized protein YktA (UPF0223 family)
MDKPENVKMPLEFVVGVYELLLRLDGRWPDEETKSICSFLEQQVKTKINAIERRNAFTAYKRTADGSQEREKLRQEYLDTVGVHPAWRTAKETHIP